jgi:hypothetical protein
VHSAAPAPGGAHAAAAGTVGIVGQERDWDELAAGARRPDDARSGALRKTRLEERSEEVLMVHTAVRVTELSTCNVQTLKARHVTGRAAP